MAPPDRSVQIDLRGEVALVTGAARGIGRGIAEAIGRAGATVAVQYRASATEAEELARSLPAARTFCAELGDEAGVRALHAQVVAALGEVTILVNNAGNWEHNPIGEPGSFARYRRLMSVNLDAAYLLCDLVAPAMSQRGVGSIVNVSSRAGKRGESRAAHYAASKGGMNAMTVSLARELGRHGVRVNAIAPGWIETPLTEAHLSDPAVRELVLRETLVGRVGVAADIAGVALFLVSPLAGYVTGQVVHVNGGSYTNT